MPINNNNNTDKTIITDIEDGNLKSEDQDQVEKQNQEKKLKNKNRNLDGNKIDWYIAQYYY